MSPRRCRPEPLLDQSLLLFELLGLVEVHRRILIDIARHLPVRGVAQHRLPLRAGDRVSRRSRTIRLAEDFGTPLAGALRALAIDLRALRRQRLQEAALRAPITMLLPTAGFILVPIFAIILGPIALRVATGTLF